MKKLFALFALVVMSTAVHAQKYHYDVNGDGMVNVSDVTSFVNNILGVPNGGEEEKNYVYDVNGDGIANVSDVTCLVNKILGVLNPGEDTKPCLTCPDDHHPHLIDLGLPSGTMWACCNVDTENPGKQSPSNYGGYYAWGETEVKEDYSWSTYAYGKRPSDCEDLGNDIARTQYDVAHVKWGGCWMMPSFDQMKELVNECTYTRTSMDGVEGALFTGPSGSTIFLPVAGYYWYDELIDAGNNGYYWSSTQNPSEAYGAYALYFGTGSAYNSYSRQYGQMVRPVCPANLLLSTTSLYLALGAVGTVDITLGSGSYTVESSDPGVATATLEGSQVTVTATGLGNAVVMVTDMLTGQKETIEVAVVNLSLSTTSLHLVPDSVETVEITSGSGSYTVESSDNGVATATLDGLQVTVTATGLGYAIITVADTWTGQKATIEVVVVDNLKLSTSSLRFLSRNMETVDITSGSGSYTVESSDPEVVTATLEGTKVTVLPIYHGTAVVTVTDVLTGQKATIEVVVFEDLTLYDEGLRLIPPNAKGTVTITSGSGSYGLECKSSDVCTMKLVGNQITVYGQNFGQASILVTDLVTGQQTTLEIIVTCCPDDHHPHMIDLGLPSGTKWACCNVDTKNPVNQSPTNRGSYYAWGETEVKSNYSEKTYSYAKIGSDIAGTRYDVAHVKWGGTWVMPSKKQIDELVDKCTYKWTKVDGVNGGMFTSKKNGKSIFLPAAGFRWKGDLYKNSSRGDYWSSTHSSNDGATSCYLRIDSGDADSYYNGRKHGRSVRPVSK